MSLRPRANRFGGCFCLGSGPVLWLCVVSAVCFAVSAGETQVWLGDLRVVAFGLVVVFVVVVVASIDLPFSRTFCPCLCIPCLLSCKDRASARHRPHSRKKKEVKVGHTEERAKELLECIDEILRQDSVGTKTLERLHGRIVWFRTFVFGGD